MILSCADSRVDPAQISMPARRNVRRPQYRGAAPPYETSRGFHGVSAALEFAVTQLEGRRDLVMGHGCAGVARRR